MGESIENKCSGKFFDSFGNKINNEIYINGAKELGKKISELIKLLNPEKIIFSGPLLDIGSFFKETIKKTIITNIKKIHLDNCEIIFSNLKNQGLFGAFSLFI